MKWVFAAAFALTLSRHRRRSRSVRTATSTSRSCAASTGSTMSAATISAQACGKDGRNRLRLVYNAIYDEQVRTYEVFLQPDGTAGLQMGVLADQGNVANLLIGDPGDVTNPWRMRRGERILHCRRNPRPAGIAPGKCRVRPAARRFAAAGCGFLVDRRLVPQRRLGLSGLSLSDRRFRKREVRREAVLLGHRAGSGQSAAQARAGGTAPRPERPAQPLEGEPVDLDGGEGWAASRGSGIAWATI